jgi:beta-phosphoglucomutase
MSKTIKGFFFDLDGTLIDTEEANFQAYQQAIFTICGVKITKANYKKIHGMAYKDFLPILVAGINDIDIDAISKQKKVLYKEQMHLTKPNMFLIEFLKRMADDYITCLVTTAKRDNANHVINAYGIKDIFNYKVFGDDVKQMKPDPEAYNVALAMSGLKPDEVIAFEDSQVGIRAANAAGISTIHIRSFL